MWLEEWWQTWIGLTEPQVSKQVSETAEGIVIVHNNINTAFGLTELCSSPGKITLLLSLTEEDFF